MFNPMQDENDIRTARSLYNARKSESPLIAWICSEGWTTAPCTYPTRGSAITVKGEVYEDAISGEINAYTRDHVDMWANVCEVCNGKGWIRLNHAASSTCYKCGGK